MSKDILIVYFTRSDNTQKIAEIIQDKTGGKLFEIEPKDPYPEAYQQVVEQANKEIQAGYCPKLKTQIENLEVYDTIFVGTPNWWSTMAPPIATFLKEYQLQGKTIVPFCTHGGGGVGHIMSDIERACPQATVLEGLAIYGSGGADIEVEVLSWLKKIGILS